MVRNAGKQYYSRPDLSEYTQIKICRKKHISLPILIQVSKLLINRKYEEEKRIVDVLINVTKNHS